MAPDFDLYPLYHPLDGPERYLVQLDSITAIAVQGLNQFNTPTYVWKRWHGSLLAMGLSLFAVGCNTALAGRVPLV